MKITVEISEARRFVDARTHSPSDVIWKIAFFPTNAESRENARKGGSFWNVSGLQIDIEQEQRNRLNWSIPDCCRMDRKGSSINDNARKLNFWICRKFSRMSWEPTTAKTAHPLFETVPPETARLATIPPARSLLTKKALNRAAPDRTASNGGVCLSNTGRARSRPLLQGNLAKNELLAEDRNAACSGSSIEVGQRLTAQQKAKLPEFNVCLDTRHIWRTRKFWIGPIDTEENSRNGRNSQSSTFLTKEKEICEATIPNHDKSRAE